MREPMTPGVPREARSVSGHDLGREVWAASEWRTITGIQHYHDHDDHMVSIQFGDDWNTDYVVVRPHDVVQVRGTTA